MGNEPDVEAIISAIAVYLRANPGACDTAEGIRRWWLSPDLECTQDTVMLALDWMKRHDLLEMTTAADGRRRFSLRGTGEQLGAVIRKPSGDRTVP